MRLFVGVALGDEVVRQLHVLLDVLHERAAEMAPRARITWVPPERLHVTVRFIGNVDDHRTRAIRSALEAPLTVKPFNLIVAGVGTFPKGRPPRVIWAGISQGLSELQQMEQEISGRLERRGIAREERDYTPHVTLARVRDAAGLRASPLLQGLSEGTLGTSRVDAATLFESRLSPKGPAYISLQRTPLAAL